VPQRFIPPRKSAFDSRSKFKNTGVVWQRLGGGIQFSQGMIVIAIAIIIKVSLRQVSFASIGRYTLRCVHRRLGPIAPAPIPSARNPVKIEV